MGILIQAFRGQFIHFVYEVRRIRCCYMLAEGGKMMVFVLHILINVFKPTTQLRAFLSSLSLQSVEQNWS